MMRLCSPSPSGYLLKPLKFARNRVRFQHSSEKLSPPRTKISSWNRRLAHRMDSQRINIGTTHRGPWPAYHAYAGMDLLNKPARHPLAHSVLGPQFADRLRSAGSGVDGRTAHPLVSRSRHYSHARLFVR